MNHRRLVAPLACVVFAGAVRCGTAAPALGGAAQSGERRLVPLNDPQDGFITFVQNSPLPNMPAFPDASPQQLADIWAYIRTIPADAPALGDIPLLSDIQQRKTRAAAE